MEAAIVPALISGTLKVVGNKLAPLLFKEYGSIVGVTKDLQELHDLVEEINCWLEKFGDKARVIGPSFNWLKKLKDVSYDVDDLLDLFHLEAEKHDTDGSKSIVSKYMYIKPKSFLLQCKAAYKIKAIKRRFAAIVKQRNDFGAIARSLADPVQHINNTSRAMPTLPNVDEASVFGRDQDKRQIISMLVDTDDQQRIKIVSVIGLGGSGKTTLAKLVFNEGNIKEKHFDVRLWVYVSKEFDVENLIKKLFEAFADNNPGQHALPYMTKTISDKLTGKKFLLVLDDVWTESKNKWDEQVMVHLQSCKPGSRILLTTRSRRVAEAWGSTNHGLSFLSSGDSWQLFQQSLGMPAQGLPSEFVVVGKEIVNKCGGVPLAIKALAGVLRPKELIGEWQAMRDSNLLDVEGEEHGVSVSACFMLSYFHLPSHLKQCFTICSVFPKGHIIDKEQLIDLWIAHDMITPEAGVDCLEYIGQRHFNSLVQMSFLQDVEEKYGRMICKMHDLVHDLGLSILGDEISLVVPKEEEATSFTKSYRYFSLTEHQENLVPKNILKKARAVYLTWCNDYTYGMAFKHAKHLRSIMVGSLDEAAVPNTAFQVQNLKCLALTRLNCEALPEAISDVWSLQALHVTQSFDLLELPKSIGKLKKLRTLNLSCCSHLTSLPDSLGDCHMISSIDLLGCWNIRLPDSIGRNEKLRILRLGYTNLVRLPLGITSLRNLECLDLRGCYKLEELPEGVGNLKKLEVLNLEGCRVLRAMPVGIGQLTRLQTLSLFTVVEGDESARISELGPLTRLGEELWIRHISGLMDPADAHKACLKQKTNLQSLNLMWGRRNHTDEVNTEIEKAVLDGLEPPPGIKRLKIDGYAGRRYARWMLKQAGARVQGVVPQFLCLTRMTLSYFPNLKHLGGLVELPCLEYLELSEMPALESISGGPFPSLMELRMEDLPRLGEVWMVTVIAGGEEGKLQIGRN